MRQLQSSGVQSMPSHLQHRVVLGRELAVRRSRERALVGAVKLVADHRGPQRRQMHADLVLAPCLQSTVDERVRSTLQPRSDLPHVDDGRGMKPFGRFARAHLHAQRVGDVHLEVAHVPKAGRAVAAVGHAPREGGVRLGYLAALLELFFEQTIAGPGLRNEHDPARFAIEAVAERQKFAVRARCLKHLDDRVPVVSRRRVHWQKRRLVDRQQVFVFVEHREIDGGGCLVPGGAPEQDVLIGLHAVVRIELAASRVVRAGAHDRLGARAARPVQLVAHENVEALPRHLRRRSEHGDDRLIRHPRGTRIADLRRAQSRHAPPA